MVATTTGAMTNQENTGDDIDDIQEYEVVFTVTQLYRTKAWGRDIEQARQDVRMMITSGEYKHPEDAWYDILELKPLPNAQPTEPTESSARGER